jgi:hypothetical protein
MRAIRRSSGTASATWWQPARFLTPSRALAVSGDVSLAHMSGTLARRRTSVDDAVDRLRPR